VLHSTLVAASPEFRHPQSLQRICVAWPHCEDSLRQRFSVGQEQIIGGGGQDLRQFKLGFGVAWIQLGGATEVAGRMPFVAQGEVCQSELVICLRVAGRHLNCILKFKNGAIVFLLREMTLAQFQKSIDRIAAAAKGYDQAKRHKGGS
jgi:hypothetical protein